jgi:putative PIN family toxin of toxin-antitoxin system
MIPLRLVLDTHIVVSAALRPAGLQRTILLLALSKPARLYISEPILAEYRSVLSRPEFKIRKGLQRQLLDLIARRTRCVVPRLHRQVTSDPGDNIFIECADAAAADYLVTGNLRHFPRYWKSTKIVSSREFLDLLAPHLIQ